MKELTYDELIKITVVIMKLIQTDLLNMLVTGLAKFLMALKVLLVTLPTNLNNLNYKGW